MSRRCFSFGPAYVMVVGLVGAAVVAHAVRELTTGDFGYGWLLLAVLTIVGGSFTVKMPGLPASISVSETFIFTMILIYGGAPATITVAVDGLVTAWRRKNLTPTRAVFNFAEPAISTAAAAAAFVYAVGRPLAAADASVSQLLGPALLLCSVYFLSNSWLNAIAVFSETGVAPHRIWRKYFMWVGLNYFGGASIAVLLAVNRGEFGLASLGLIMPLVGISYLTFKSSMARVEDANQHLGQLNKLYLSTVETLAMAIDAKDQITHGHIRRVQAIAVGLARELGINDERDIKAIEAAALLHDMGKLAVPEHILNKPGKLTPAEYEKMKLHAPVGAEILAAVDFPYPVVPIVRHHHENWDGAGYPDRLHGEAIPIGARILAVVDCYDALTSDRPYRRALSDSDAVAIVQQRRGSMYDPTVVDAFVRCRGALLTLMAQVDAGLVQTSPLAHAARSGTATEAPDDRGVEPADDESARFPAVWDASEPVPAGCQLEDLCEAVARRVRRVLPAPLVVFYVHEEATDRLKVGYASGYGEAGMLGVELPVGAGLSGWVAANRSTIVNADPALDVAIALGAMPSQLDSALSTPLVSESRLVGVLTLYAAKAGTFCDEHRIQIEQLARDIAPAFERAVQLRRTLGRAVRDPLTGLFDELGFGCAPFDGSTPAALLETAGRRLRPYAAPGGRSHHASSRAGETPAPVGA